MKILEILTPKRKIGNRGERLAAGYLKKNGYKIKAKNYVANGNEIDIIAESKTTLAFVEVKTRTLGHENPKEPRPASSVTQEKQRKIISAVKFYLAKNPPNRHVSLDIVEVYLDSDGRKNKIIHMQNAFNINTAYERKAYRK